MGRRLFFDDNAEVLEDLDDVISGNTLYISEGEDWIGKTRICCFPLPY